MPAIGRCPQFQLYPICRWAATAWDAGLGQFRAAAAAAGLAELAASTNGVN